MYIFLLLLVIFTVFSVDEHFYLNHSFITANTINDSSISDQWSLLYKINIEHNMCLLLEWLHFLQTLIPCRVWIPNNPWRTRDSYGMSEISAVYRWDLTITSLVVRRCGFTYINLTAVDPDMLLCLYITPFAFALACFPVALSTVHIWYTLVSRRVTTKMYSPGHFSGTLFEGWTLLNRPCHI